MHQVFNKAAYVAITIVSVKGRGRLQFSRNPYTHYSFAFYEVMTFVCISTHTCTYTHVHVHTHTHTHQDPEIEMKVESNFEGRRVPQLSSFIENQVRHLSHSVCFCTRHMLYSLTTCTANKMGKKKTHLTSFQKKVCILKVVRIVPYEYVLKSYRFKPFFEKFQATESIAGRKLNTFLNTTFFFQLGIFTYM